MTVVKDRRRDDRITIRIPSELREALEREATAQKRSVSDVIILHLEAALAKKPELVHVVIDPRKASAAEIADTLNQIRDVARKGK